MSNRQPIGCLFMLMLIPIWVFWSFMYKLAEESFVIPKNKGKEANITEIYSVMDA
jgi:hypothetical protein